MRKITLCKAQTPVIRLKIHWLVVKLHTNAWEVIELANKAGMPVEVRAVSEAELRSADEIWITSATREVLAVNALDGKPVGAGTPGPVFRRMHGLFREFKAQLAASGPRHA